MGGGTPRPVAVNDTLAIFGDDSYYLYAINHLTGDEVFRFRFDTNEVGGIRTVLIAGDEVYFMARTKRVYAYKLQCPQLEAK